MPNWEPRKNTFKHFPVSCSARIQTCIFFFPVQWMLFGKYLFPWDWKEGGKCAYRSLCSNLWKLSGCTADKSFKHLWCGSAPPGAQEVWEGCWKGRLSSGVWGCLEGPSRHPTRWKLNSPVGHHLPLETLSCKFKFAIFSLLVVLEMNPNFKRQPAFHRQVKVKWFVLSTLKFFRCASALLLNTGRALGYV